MKTIIDIGTLTLKQVPKEYIECSVCGHYHPFESYCKDNVQDRTNCEEYYNLPYKEMKAKGIKTSLVKSKSTDYRNVWESLLEISNFVSNSIPVEVMIAALQQLPAGS